MILESHWRTLKHDYLHRFNGPRVDLVMLILTSRVIPNAVHRMEVSRLYIAVLPRLALDITIKLSSSLHLVSCRNRKPFKWAIPRIQSSVARGIQENVGKNSPQSSRPRQIQSIGLVLVNPFWLAAFHFANTLFM
jgi:hypothetical protein